jgi:alpha-glucosidase
LASLNIDAIWISPFNKSPMKDYGYDVSDYRDVDPLFGNLADFDRLLAKAHDLNIKIIMDFVLCHTSDQHAWFTESRSNRTNPKADWYVWADPKPDGTPPNNWQSIFGGSAWTYDMRRGQYYWHTFLVEQPALNYHNPDVRTAILNEMRFWLDRGVDGFRLDAIVHCYFDKDLKDNPPNPVPASPQFHSQYPSPYFMQDHPHDREQPETISLLHELRAIADEYGDRVVLIGEVGAEKNSLQICAEYTATPELLHTAYNFDILSGSFLNGNEIRRCVETFYGCDGSGWSSWAFSNHDFARAASRWLKTRENDYDHNQEFSKILIALLTSLKGTPFIYQGEELGLPEAELAYEDILDPWGKYLYPAWQGRDGCRTPIPWDKTQPSAGFSVATKNWLPIPDAHKALNVESQEQNPQSVLNFTREFLAWRKQHPAMINGEIEFLESSEDHLVFTRYNADEKITCTFDFIKNTFDFK